MSLHLVNYSEDERDALESTFFVASRLVPEGQKVLKVPPDTSVSRALALMKEHDFSQVPVVLAEREVIGVFTYRSFARQIVKLPKQASPLEEAVADLLEPARFARATTPLGEFHDLVNHDGYILLGDEHNLLAVVTSEDVTNFLFNTAHPILLLRNIELAVRALMRTACDSESALRRCIALGTKSSDQLGEGDVPGLETLSFGETINVISNGDNYTAYFIRTFGQNRHIARSRLEEVREIRNQVFHFRSDTTVEQLEVLASTQNWLHQKLATVRHTQ